MRGRGPARALEGTTRDLGRRGEGVVVTPAGVMFVPGALVGERVLVQPRPGRGKAVGRLLRVLEASPDRVEPPCARAGECGGCPLMILSLEAQRATKAAWIARAVGFSPTPGAAGAPLAYRRRARLRFEVSGAGRTLGLRALASHRVVDLSACPVLSRPLAEGLAHARARILPLLAGEGELLLYEGRAGRPALAIVSDSPQAPALYEAARALVGSTDAPVAGVAFKVGGATAFACEGDAREHLVAADGAPLVAPAGGFSQAHDAVSRQLVSVATRLAQPGGARVLELYAGSGNLTVALAPGAASLTAVELGPDAVAACRENLRSRGLLAARVVCGAAEDHAGGPGVDVVVLDPPRAGAALVLEGIAARRPSRIVYVSCDPPTLRRDVGRLRGLGYAPDAATVFDMFPQTAHVEAVVRLVPAATGSGAGAPPTSGLPDPPTSSSFGPP